MAKALVCGAGVGGLAAAVSLKRAGFDVAVFEMHPELRTAGVGMNIWPNGVSVIRGLGLGEGFQGVSAVMKFCRSIDTDGATTSNVDVRHWESEYGAPLTGAHRRNLNALLASALDPGELHFEHAARSYEQDDESVTVRFANGETASGDVLVGADGVGSEIRNFMLGAEPEFTTDNLLRWRGVFSCADADVEEDVQCDVIGDAGHFGWIPIGAGKAYWFASSQGVNTLDDFMACFTSWTSTPAPRLISVTPRETIINNTLVGYRRHLTSWVDGRVALLGDAAHPMLPGMAQGACQALEDTVALARHLGSGADVPAALQRYQSERMPLANRMVEYSRMLFDFEESHTAYSTKLENQIISRYEHFERLRRAGQ